MIQYPLTQSLYFRLVEIEVSKSPKFEKTFHQREIQRENLEKGLIYSMEFSTESRIIVE